MAFDEAWLAAHNTKMAVLRGQPTKPAPGIIVFSIPLATKLPNRSSGQHWTAAHAYRKKLLPLVAEAVKPWSGHLPMERARVTIVRYSCGIQPDQDNVVASCKQLIDLLLVRTKTHPHSLGLIVDDSPDRLTMTATSARVATRKEARTCVQIERIDG